MSRRRSPFALAALFATIGLGAAIVAGTNITSFNISYDPSRALHKERSAGATRHLSGQAGETVEARIWRRGSGEQAPSTNDGGDAEIVLAVNAQTERGRARVIACGPAPQILQL